MVTLMNKKLANKNLVTAYGKLQFSAEGEVEVEETVARKLATLKDFSIVGEEEAVDETSEDEVGEDLTDEESDADEADDENTENDEEETDVEETSITKEELEKMSVKQLEKFAKDNDIDLGSATRKADIIAVILGE